jgi:hypothetical protein
MTRTLSLLAVAAVLPLPFVLPACGAGQPGGASPAASGSAAAGPTPKAEQIRDHGYFDVGTFFPTPPAVTGRVGNEALLGVMLSARPVVMECLVDPKNRGADKSTRVVLDSTLGDAGVDHQVSGQNLTPTGIACITAALRAFTQASPGLTSKNAASAGGGAGAVKGHLELEHVVGASPAVVLGTNDASDIAAAVRLGLSGWSDCFADWKASAPRTLKATLTANRPKVAAPTVTLSAVTFDPPADPIAAKVAACLEGKIKALPVKAPSSDSVTLPYTFRFVHSGIFEPLPDAAPQLQFVEIDLQRSRRAAEAAIALGSQGQAAVVYDDAVKRFKAKAKPEVSIADLKEKCAALLAADDKLIGAADAMVATEDGAHRFTVDQKAKDPSWGEAETIAAKNLADAQKDAAKDKAVRKTDEAACPKVSY